MLDRTIAPEFVLPDKFEIQQAVSRKLNNGIPVYIINAGKQPVIRIEFIFPAGNWHEQKNGEAYFTVKMLGEGTKRRTAKEIEEFIAQYGAFLDLNCGNDKITVVLYALEKHLEKMLPILKEILTEPAFGEKELSNIANITAQGIKVNLEKTSYVAGRAFKDAIFGQNHPYGRSINEEEIKNISSADLKAFFSKNYVFANCLIVASGAVEEYALQQLNESFGNLALGVSTSSPNRSFDYKPSSKVIEKKDSLQSSLRLGLPVVGINHHDYFRLHLTIEILGGYFGSRLMKNIREDKGYTYGIYSSLVNMQNASYMVIGTDVKKEFTGNTIEEIHKEIKTLATEEVGSEELENVKNYLIGSFLNSINTPFALADKFKTIYFNDLSYSFYDQYLVSLKSLTAEDVIQTAQEYLVTDEMSEVVVGGK